MTLGWAGLKLGWSKFRCTNHPWSLEDKRYHYQEDDGMITFMDNATSSYFAAIKNCMNNNRQGERGQDTPSADNQVKWR